MKRSITSLALVLLLASFAVPAGAGERAPVPVKPNIVDPGGDANGAWVVDQATPIQVEAADMLEIWLTADKDTVTANWHVAGMPQEQGIVLLLHAIPNPTEPVSHDRLHRPSCVYFGAAFPHPAQDNEAYTITEDFCTYTDLVLRGYGKPSVRTLEDGTVIVSATFKRKTTPAFKSGTVLTRPRARAGFWVSIPNQGYLGGHPYLDMTAIGRDFRMP